MGDSTDDGCAILVTGGAGSLGQHLIGLLQTRADHVTEIRVLDVVPYENKLDYKHTKPVRCYVGSITDESVLKKACTGVQCVIHLAAIADFRMFPETTRINEVNVRGTCLTLLTALETNGVQRFIYCSSMSVSIGNNDVTQGIVESDPIPSKLYFEPYATSKLAGERIVLSANGPSFRTVCIRPLVMWGELDTVFVNLSQRLAKDTFGYLPAVACGDIKQQNSYVGNTAWGFVCAERKLFNEMKEIRGKNEPNDYKQVDWSKEEFCSQLRSHSQEMSENLQKDTLFDDLKTTKRENSAENIYFIADDTPLENPFKFQHYFLEPTGYAVTKFTIPLFITKFIFSCIYFCIFILRCFGLKPNYPVASGSLCYCEKAYTFNDDKARSEIGYSPIFTPKQAFKRSLGYYSKNAYKKTQVPSKRKSCGSHMP